MIPSYYYSYYIVRRDDSTIAEFALLYGCAREVSILSFFICLSAGALECILVALL